MASTSLQNNQTYNRLPGRFALSGRALTTIANPDGGKPGLVISEMAHLGKLNLRGGTDMLATIKSHTGCKILPANNRFETVGDRQLIWLGPDEFLLLCEAGRERELRAELMLGFDGIHAAVTNVTDSLCALNLRGPALRRVLAKGCALDLHPSKFAAGHAAQTLLSHAAITLLAIDQDKFTLICRTSFAPYVADWLEDAALEFGVAFRA
ncbi:MAG: sarcosine oxidase subunit gamma [Bacteroidetes bacterium]|jgi:sarcosine oxidase subunit gamma|nr:sarcosine oxidase subunit gamma [Bacteroidota bacterium]